MVPTLALWRCGGQCHKQRTCVSPYVMCMLEYRREKRRGEEGGRGVVVSPVSRPSPLIHVMAVSPWGQIGRRHIKWVEMSPLPWRAFFVYVFFLFPLIFCLNSGIVYCAPFVVLCEGYFDCGWARMEGWGWGWGREIARLFGVIFCMRGGEKWSVVRISVLARLLFSQRMMEEQW